MTRATHPYPRALFCALIVIIAGAGCAGPAPTTEISWAAEETYDGLRLVNDTRAQRVWIRPDLDLTRYTAVWPQNAGIQYRPVEGGSTANARRGQTEFPVSEAGKQRLSELVSEAFQTELARLERFDRVDGPGPNVMIVRGALLDVVSFVPPQPVGRGDIFLRTVGALTFVVELRDSETNTIIARVADRRAADRPGNTAQASNAVTNGAEVRRVAQRWARWLREGLDNLPNHTPADD